MTLLPCPFCGSDAELTEYNGNYYKPDWTVQCKKCDFSIEGDPTPEKSTARWNTRALPDAAQAKIRELESAIRRCIVDLEAARLLAQHTLGEPHGINQTLDIARAALTPEK